MAAVVGLSASRGEERALTGADKHVAHGADRRARERLAVLINKFRPR